MLKPFKTTHHFEAVLETGMVCLIAHFNYREEALSNLLLDNTRFLRETGSAIGHLH